MFSFTWDSVAIGRNTVISIVIKLMFQLANISLSNRAYILKESHEEKTHIVVSVLYNKQLY